MNLKFSLYTAISLAISSTVSLASHLVAKQMLTKDKFA